MAYTHSGPYIFFMGTFGSYIHPTGTPGIGQQHRSDTILERVELVWCDELPRLVLGSRCLQPRAATARASARTSALEGGPEYQCGYVWNGNLYLGTGPSTNNNRLQRLRKDPQI